MRILLFGVVYYSVRKVEQAFESVGEILKFNLL